MQEKEEMSVWAWECNNIAKSVPVLIKIQKINTTYPVHIHNQSPTYLILH